MDNLASTILILFLGTIIGAVIAIFINYIRGINVQNKANKLLEDAKKEAERHKRDALLELKEESYKLKQ